MDRIRTAGCLLLLSALAMGARPGELLERLPAARPLLRTPPAALNFATMSTSHQLQSGFDQFPDFQRLRNALCRGDEEGRAAYLSGVARALAVPVGQRGRLESTYLEVSTVCATMLHCDWMRRELELASEPLQGFLWRAVARCHPLERAAFFERPSAPGDAVVAFHSRRRIETVHSVRLGHLVEDAVEVGDIEALRAPLAAYARMDHPDTARRLVELHSRELSDDLRTALADAMRFQSDPAAAQLFQETCRSDLERSMQSWRKSGSGPRGSPTRWGDPCRTTPWGSYTAKSGSERDPVAAFPVELGRAARLTIGPGWQFAEQTLPLWEIAALVRPDLDDAIFADVWPAVDAVRVHRGSEEAQVFVNGDAVLVSVPLNESRPDLAVAEEIRIELEAALEEPRHVSVWFRQERLRFHYRRRGNEYDTTALVNIANWLLSESGSKRRVAQLAGNAGFAVQIGTGEQVARAKQRGLHERRGGEAPEESK